MSNILEIVKEQSSSNVKRWKKYALNHIVRIMGCSSDQANNLYKLALSQSYKIIFNVDIDDSINFLCGGELSQKDNEIRRQARNALNIHKESPLWASFTKNQEGDRRFGAVSLSLDGINKYLVFQGDPSRLRDPSRVDFLTDPIEGMFAKEDRHDCRAIATILAMGPSEMAGMKIAIDSIQSNTVDFGRCTALIFDKISPDNISSIFTSKQDDLESIRKILNNISKAIPASISNSGIRSKDPFSYRESDGYSVKQSVNQNYFNVGDRICTKRTVTTSPLVTGTIIDIANGQVAIQWDHDKRSIIDWAEALMTLIPRPEINEVSAGDVIYSTPGMDSKTIKLLSAFSIDPITLYSLATHCFAYGEKDFGGKEKLKESIRNIGLKGTFVKGYTETDSYFEPSEWFEARLPSGMRVILDFSDSKLNIIAGEAEEYIIPSEIINE